MVPPPPPPGRRWPSRWPTSARTASLRRPVGRPRRSSTMRAWRRGVRLASSSTPPARRPRRSSPRPSSSAPGSCGATGPSATAAGRWRAPRTMATAMTTARTPATIEPLPLPSRPPGCRRRREACRCRWPMRQAMSTRTTGRTPPRRCRTSPHDSRCRTSPHDSRRRTSPHDRARTSPLGPCPPLRHAVARKGAPHTPPEVAPRPLPDVAAAAKLSELIELPALRARERIISPPPRPEAPARAASPAAGADPPSGSARPSEQSACAAPAATAAGTAGAVGTGRKSGASPASDRARAAGGYAHPARRPGLGRLRRRRGPLDSVGRVPSDHPWGK